MKHLELVKTILSKGIDLEKATGIETIMIIDEIDAFINNYISVELNKKIFNDKNIKRVEEKST